MSEPASSPPSALACLVLAAGKGTRMRSSRSKVLHEILGAPLVSYPIRRAEELGAEPIVAVLGHQRAEVERELVARHGREAIAVVEQTEQRGTGHAVRLGLEPLAGFDGFVLILYGDTPLLQTENLRALVDVAKKRRGLALLTSEVPDPTGYGRIVRDDQGSVRRIVEHKDASPAERAIREINAGIYCAPAAFLREATARLEPKNAQGEYYLTDIVEMAAVGGLGVESVLADVADIAGVNDRAQLADAERVLRDRLVRRHLEQASFRDPFTVAVEEGVTIGADTVIGRNVALRGATRIGSGVIVDDGAILTDVVVDDGARIGAHAVITGQTIAAGRIVAPLVRIP